MIRVLEDTGDSSGTLIVPSRQRAEAARVALARAAVRAGAQVWATPDILSADTWIGREIEAAAWLRPLPRLLSGAQEWLLWRQCAADFTDHLELVARGALAESLQRAAALAAEFEIPVSKSSGGGAPESALLNEVRQAVEERARAAGVASARTLAAMLPCIGTDRAVEFAGYAQLPPYLQSIFAARESCALPTRMRASAAPERRALKIVAADRTEELERIAAWCRAQLDANADARTLVVLPGASALRERLATLLRQSLAPQRWVDSGSAPRDPAALVAIEGGEPLARAPVVAHALTALSLLTGASGFDAVSAWLCAPYWRLPDAAARARLDLRLRALAPVELDLAALLALLSAEPPLRHAASTAAALELRAQLLGAAAPLQPRSGTPREWAERMRGSLAALGWPGDAVRGSEAQQTLLRFNELLDEFGELAIAARVMSRERALQIFSELAARTRFRPASGDALVTVTGRLEDPVVHYEGIWIAGMDATSWPEPVQLNPFLAQAAQRAAGIPAASAEGRTAAARALMLAWRAAADELVFSVATRDEDLEILPSALLREWHSEAPTPAHSGLWLPVKLRRPDAVESLIDASAPVWPADARLPSGTRLLELQSLCAFRAFGELRLNSRLLDEPTPGVPPLERGQFLHAALEALWKMLRDWESLQALSSDALAALVARAVAQAAQQLWGGPHTRPQAREGRRARELLRAVCELERTREPFRVRDTELPASVALAGRRLDLRIDRVDALATGGLAILDYKSGTHRKMDWYGEHLSHPQLLAYLLALDEDVRALATVNVAVRDVGFHGIAVTQGLLPKLEAAAAQEGPAEDGAWEGSREFWRQRLEALARDFLDGRAAVDPAPNACKYCDVASLCRIADRAATSADEDAQGVSDD